MKIAIVTNYFYPVEGGVERHTYYIAKNLVERGHKVTVITSDKTRDSKTLKKYEVKDKIRIIRLPVLIKIGDFGVIFPRVIKEIKKISPDIVHLHVFRHFHNLIPFFIKKPCIITPHWPNYPKEVRKPYVDILVSLFDRILGKAVLKKCRKIIAITDLEKEWLVGKFKINQRNIEVIPNGIPKEYLKKRYGTKVRKKLNLRRNQKIVLCISRLHKSKGIDQVIKIATFFKDVVFLIAGRDGGEKKNLLKLAKPLKNIHFIENVSDEKKLELYAASDVFVHPSHYEGFGIVVLEAFSQGVAVITSDKGGLPWVVSDAGLIFKDKDLKDLKDKLSLLLKEDKLRKNLAKKGKNRVKDFTWENIVNKIEKVYEKAIWKR